MSQTPRLLLVEDALDIQMMVRSAIGKQFNLTCVTSAEEALKEIQLRSYSLLILDVNLPGDDGFKLCSAIRLKANYKDTPIVFLTGNQKTSDKIMAFSLGADDYLVKPIDPAEFQARIEAKMRKLLQSERDHNTYRKGPFRVALAEQKIFVETASHQECDLHLSSIEFKLLYYFLRHEEHILSREQILNEVWGADKHVTDRVVDSYIYALRKKLAGLAGSIQTVPRVGYKLSLSETALSA